jgi:amidohydrolase
MDPIRTAAQDLASDTVALRRDLHAHPEIAFEEVRTAGIVAERLRSLGLEPRTGLGGTGVVAVLEGARPGRTVLARADIDALPMPDDKTVDYRSTNANACHACGHDGHTSVLLAVARILSERKADLRGRVVFVFQPAEEIVQGAAAMIKDGALDGIEADTAVGLHLSTMHPTGTVALRAGPAMAAADAFRLIVRGHGGHAAKPNETVDPIVIAAQLITALQTLVARETDPVDQAVLSITSVHGGTAFNIIPEEVELKGTLRSFDAATRERHRSRIAALAEAIATGMRGSVVVDWRDGSPTVVNDEAATERVRHVAEGIDGIDHVIVAAQIMGGDDMSLWLQRAPGCYWFVGARAGEASAFPHHHPSFDIDEAALPLAVELFTKVILDALDA